MSYASLGRVNIRQQLDSAYRKSVHDFNETVSKNRYILNKLIDCVKFCGVFELALRGHDESDSSNNPGIFRGLIDFVSELDSLFKEHIERSTVFKRTSKTVQNEILDSMLAVLQEHIIKEIDQANFVAIQADESPDNSNKTQMIFIFRYVLEGIVHERFWKFVNPPGTTSEYLTTAILEELQLLKINEAPHKLIAQSYDGASVMSGKLGGVQTKVKELYPNANFIHCYAHQLNLILQKAASQHKPIKIFFANLHSFSTFFRRSPKRTVVLDKVVKVRLPKAAPTRWAFNTKCVETVYTHKDDLIICLDQIIDEEEDDNNINQATGLKRHLEDEVFLFWLHFFHKIMPHVDILFKQLQMRDLDVISVKNCITSFYNSIQKVRNAILESEEPSTSTAKRRKTNAENPKRRTALEICDIIISEIHHRFAFSDHLIISQLFQTDKFEVYSTNFPQNILNMVKVNYPTINISKLQSELEVIYCREDFRNSAGAIAILQLFLNMNLSETFSEVVNLLNILCTIPMTTVESERCFSTLKRVKTFLRNSMGQSRLSALCMLNTEKTLVQTISNFNEKVIDRFAELKERRIDLKYKQF